MTHDDFQPKFGGRNGDWCLVTGVGKEAKRHAYVLSTSDLALPCRLPVDNWLRRGPQRSEPFLLHHVCLSPLAFSPPFHSTFHKPWRPFVND